MAREPKEETAGIKGKKFDSKNVKVVEELIQKDEGNNIVEDNHLDQ